MVEDSGIAEEKKVQKSETNCLCTARATLLKGVNYRYEVEI